MKGIALFVLLLLGTVVAWADDFDLHCANISLLEDKRVQAEIGISAQQRTKMNQFADAYRAQINDYQKRLGNKPPDQQVVQGYFVTLRNNVISVMTPGQIKRLRELNIQASQLLGLLDPVVAKRIGMSDSQFNKYKQTYIDGKNRAGRLAQAAILPLDQKYTKLMAPYKADPQKHKAEIEKLQKQYLAEAKAIQKKVQPQIDAITKQTEQKMRGMITAQQKATWTALMGKKFTPKSK